MTATTQITHSAIQKSLEDKGFEVYGEDTGGGCWVGYALKEGGTRVTFGPYMWADGLGYVVEPGDFYIGPDTMDEETGDCIEPMPDLVTAEKGCTLEDVLSIVVSEYEKMNG